MSQQQATHAPVKAVIKTYIAEQFLYDRPEVILTDDFPLIEQNVFDSLQLMQLVTFLQKNFDILIDITELISDNFVSVNAIAALVQKQKQMAL